MDLRYQIHNKVFRRCTPLMIARLFASLHWILSIVACGNRNCIVNDNQSDNEMLTCYLDEIDIASKVYLRCINVFRFMHACTLRLHSIWIRMPNSNMSWRQVMFNRMMKKKSFEM